MEARLEKVFSAYRGSRDELIPLLQAVQEELGYLPEEAMEAIGRFAGVPESGVYAVATFYAQFRFAPIGRNHIMACRGTACHVRGAPRILEEIEHQLGLKEGETSDDLEYSLETVACIGACGLAPCITINKVVEAKVTPRSVGKLFRKLAGPAPQKDAAISAHGARRLQRETPMDAGTATDAIGGHQDPAQGSSQK